MARKVLTEEKEEKITAATLNIYQKTFKEWPITQEELIDDADSIKEYEYLVEDEG